MTAKEIRALEELAAASLQLLRDLRAELDGGSFFLASSGPERERGLRLLDRLKEALS